MTNVRPAVKMQSLPVEPIDSSKIRLSLQQALKQNKIDSIYNARLVHIDTNWFYQVKTSRRYSLQYLSAKNGNILNKGDWLYTQYLARLFLEGVPQNKKGNKAAIETPMSMSMTAGMDCCGEAASSVLNNKTGAPIESASLVTQFDDEYKSIYCLLPVYQVSFKRPDQIRLYIETGQDRLAIAVDKKRAAFTKFFDLVHTWGWVSFLGKGRLLIELFFTGLGFLTAAMGIYIFFATKSKNVPGNKLVKARRNHRYTAIIASVFTLMFTFSGGYHAFSKLDSQEKQIKQITDGFASADIDLNLGKLNRIVKKPIMNIGLVKVDGKPYWQLNLQSGNKRHKTGDLMKDMGVSGLIVQYINAADYSILPGGDEIYARLLAGRLSGHDNSEIRSAELITKFTNEYNFTDKRLPVWKINYAFDHRTRLYVETSTGILAKITNDASLYEGYSFALLHKHHYMDFGGKTTRDISTMLGAALQIIMVVIGLVFYFKWRKRKARTN
eukprot:gene14794-14926_t